MLYKILLSLLVVSLPAMAHAHIESSTSASSNSGGNVVGQGGTVTTGDSSASVQVSNTKSSGSSSSSIYIKTEANGTVHEETIHSSDAHTDVSVETTHAGTKIQVREGTPPVVVKHQVVAASGTAATSTVGAEATTTPEVPAGLASQIVLAVQSFFAGLLSWFR